MKRRTLFICFLVVLALTLSACSSSKNSSESAASDSGNSVTSGAEQQGSGNNGASASALTKNEDGTYTGTCTGQISAVNGSTYTLKITKGIGGRPAQPQTGTGAQQSSGSSAQGSAPSSGNASDPTTASDKSTYSKGAASGEKQGTPPAPQFAGETITFTVTSDTQVVKPQRSDSGMSEAQASISDVTANTLVRVELTNSQATKISIMQGAQTEKTTQN